jgi:regulator of protease activity HflC (stomatin/prohibitin superfamily)
MSLFDLLANLVEPFFDLIPRLAHRPASNEIMVVDSWTGKIKTSTFPQLYVPALTHVEYYPKHEVPTDCGIQRLTTIDGKSVAVNATASYTIDDPVLMRDKFGDNYEELATFAIRGYVCEYVNDHNFTYLPTILEGNQIWNEIAVDLSYSGIKLTDFRVEDIQEVLPLSILQ